MVDTAHADLAAREKANREPIHLGGKINLYNSMANAVPDRYDFESDVPLDRFERVAFTVLKWIAGGGVLFLVGYVAYLFGPVM